MLCRSTARAFSRCVPAVVSGFRSPISMCAFPRYNPSHFSCRYRLLVAICCVVLSSRTTAAAVVQRLRVLRTCILKALSRACAPVSPSFPPASWSPGVYACPLNYSSEATELILVRIPAGILIVTVCLFKGEKLPDRRDGGAASIHILPLSALLGTQFQTLSHQSRKPKDVSRHLIVCMRPAWPCSVERASLNKGLRLCGGRYSSACPSRYPSTRTV